MNKYRCYFFKKFRAYTNCHTQTYQLYTSDYYFAVDQIRRGLLELYPQLDADFVIKNTRIVQAKSDVTYSECWNCGKKIIKTGNTHFCSECAEQIKKLNRRIATAKYYYKTKFCTGVYQKVNARIKSNRLKNRGRLQKNCCCICGSTDKLQFHHTDYESDIAPYSVMVVCPKCHVKLHGGSFKYSNTIGGAYVDGE